VEQHVYLRTVVSVKMVWYLADIISLKCNLFLPWYGWKIAHYCVLSGEVIRIHQLYSHWFNPILSTARNTSMRTIIPLLHFFIYLRNIFNFLTGYWILQSDWLIRLEKNWLYLITWDGIVTSSTYSIANDKFK
jgi:hypothetical protein